MKNCRLLRIADRVAAGRLNHRCRKTLWSICVGLELDGTGIVGTIDRPWWSLFTCHFSSTSLELPLFECEKNAKQRCKEILMLLQTSCSFCCATGREPWDGFRCPLERYLVFVFAVQKLEDARWTLFSLPRLSPRSSYFLTDEFRRNERLFPQNTQTTIACVRLFRVHMHNAQARTRVECVSLWLCKFSDLTYDKQEAGMVKEIGTKKKLRQPTVVFGFLM